MGNNENPKKGGIDMIDSLISQERLDILAESALRQLQSGRNLNSVLIKLEEKGLSPEDAQKLGETVYKRYEKMHAEEQKKQALHEIYNETNLIKPMLGGLAGALIGSLLWGSIAFLTRHYFNAFAVLIGVFAGYGTYKFCDSKQKFKQKTKAIAGICSVIGIVVGEMLVFVCLFSLEYNPKDFDFFLYGSEELNFMRLLWAIIAIFAAIFKVPDIMSNKNYERI